MTRPSPLGSRRPGIVRACGRGAPCAGARLAIVGRRAADPARGDARAERGASGHARPAPRRARRYAALFELAPVGYVITDSQGLILELNRMAADQLGREAGFFAASRSPHSSDRRRRAPSVRCSEAARGSRWQDELPFVRSDGGRARFVVQAIGPAPGAGQQIRWSLTSPLLRRPPGAATAARRGGVHDAGRPRVGAARPSPSRSRRRRSSLRVTYQRGGRAARGRSACRGDARRPLARSVALHSGRKHVRTPRGARRSACDAR